MAGKRHFHPFGDLAMTEIHFSPTIPEYLQPEIKRVLRPLLPLVHREVSRLQISLESDVGGEAAIMVMRRYHIAYIALDASWLSLSEEDREAVLVHELMHVFVDIFTRDLKKIVDYFVPPEIEEYVADRLEDVEERLTNSLALAAHEGIKDLRRLRKAARLSESLGLGGVDGV